MVMMLCAGASEQAVSQWSSAFAEQGLGVSKTVGDLAGPMAFAAMMGVSRLIFGKYGEKLNLNRYMAVCAALCVGAYLCIVFVPSPVLSLLGCAVCRLLGRHFLARNVQPRIRLHPGRRNADVRAAGAGG